MSDDTSSHRSGGAAIPRDYQKVPWNGLAALIVVLFCYVIAQFFGSFSVTLYPHLHHWSSARANHWLSSSISAQFFYVLISESVSLFILWLFLRRYPRKIVYRVLGFTRRVSWHDIGAALAGTVSYYALYLAGLSLIMAIVQINTSQTQDVGFNGVSGAIPLILTFISLVILPPIVEEITFRGFLFSGLKKNIGFVGAALFTSLIFALPHTFEGSGGGMLWTAGIDTFFLSLVLCYLREKTGALYASIGVHMIKNSIAFVTLFILHVH